MREAWTAGRIEELTRTATEFGAVWTGGVPVGAFFGLRTTFFLIRGTEQEVSDIGSCACAGLPVPWQAATFKVLAADMPLRSVAPGNAFRDQRALAYGGTLGDFVMSQITPNSVDPSEPAFDGFGFLTDWVPPTDPELLALDGQSSTRYFLDLARRSAQEATRAVDRAFQNLVEEGQDEVTLANARDRATLLIRQESEALCGPDNVDCEVGSVLRAVDRNWYPSLLGYNLETDCQATYLLVRQTLADGNDVNNKDLAKQYLRCLVSDLVVALEGQQVHVATPVLEELDDGRTTVPTFGDFQGGELQSLMIEQFRAIRTPDERFGALLAALDAAEQRLDIAQLIVEQASEQVADDCGGLGIAAGVGNGIQATAGGVAAGAAAGAIIGCGPGAVAGAFVGGVAALGSTNDSIERCESAQEELELAQRQEMAQFLDAIAGFKAAAVGFLDSLAAISQASAAFHIAQERAGMATARHAQELALLERSLVTSFGLVRRYRAYDLWRAKALVENARRYALAARRSIEARFVVDLSRLTEDEAFVASPATWADEIYEYDLSLPSAVGLESGTEEAGGIFSNKIVDYVNNLEAFVAGFAVNRPSAAGIEDVEVITLPGLGAGEPTPLLDENGTPVLDEDGNAVTLYSEKGSWALLCPDDTRVPAEFRGRWAPATSFPDPRAACIDWNTCTPNFCNADNDVDCLLENGALCYVAPTKARLTFTLDPWGRVNGDISAPPFENRYNARWSRLAVNFVGTGVLDCDEAVDPLNCYAQGFINYDLSQRGIAWVTDFGGAWRGMPLPSARIEAGKGLAAELWLDPLKDGWGTSYIAPVARTELVDRPFGGDYDLVFDIAPETRIDRIERVQLMQGSTYWVAQDF